MKLIGELVFKDIFSNQKYTGGVPDSIDGVPSSSIGVPNCNDGVHNSVRVVNGCMHEVKNYIVVVIYRVS